MKMRVSSYENNSIVVLPSRLQIGGKTGLCVRFAHQVAHTVHFSRRVTNKVAN